MSSETDSSSSSNESSNSSDKDNKKRKSNKNHKHKSEKKHKKRKKIKEKKDKKRKSRDPKKPLQPKTIVPEISEDSFGPALPPHLLSKTNNATSSPITNQKSSIIGPILPPDFLNNEKIIVDTVSQKNDEGNDIEDDDMGYGPLPTNSSAAVTQKEQEREQRALELKIAAIEGRDLSEAASEQKSREEWMLELPDVGLRGGLAALSNMKRTFHTGKEKPDFSDRSDWTKTPHSESSSQNLVKSTPNAESLKNQAEDLYERARDAEQERLAKKHKKKHKRDESLMELHQKKLRKEQKQKLKELEASGSKPERRPFSRDVDLKLNKIDSHQTKQIVDKAKILDSKFSTGKAKYL